MTRISKFLAPSLAAALLLAAASASHAIEVSGVKLDDSVQVANHKLELNGAGLRTKAIFKVYVAALYLPKKETTTEGVYASTGARRITIVMMRDIGADEFGQAFMTGVNNNSDKAEKGKVFNQIAKLGEIFETIGALKKGDIVTLDFTPEKGTVIAINGKNTGDPLPDVAFNNTVLRNWLGDKPADASLKAQLLGGKVNPNPQVQ